MPTAQIGWVSQQKHGKITLPEPYEPTEVIIIILAIIRVNRLVVDSKESVVNNGPNCVNFTTEARKDRTSGILRTTGSHHNPH